MKSILTLLTALLAVPPAALHAAGAERNAADSRYVTGGPPAKPAVLNADDYPEMLPVLELHDP